MKEISNSTLALLVVAAIVVSISGSLISLNKLGDLGITGMLSTNNTGFGKANLTVPSSAYLNLTDDVIDLHTMEIAQQNWSEHSGIQDWWGVRNDGSVNISIVIYSHGTDDQDGGGSPVAGRGPFTSATTGSGCLANGVLDACFMVHCYNSSTSGNMTNGVMCNTTYSALPVSTGGSTSRPLVRHLMNTDNNDTAYFGVNVTVPNDEPSGDKVQLVEFLAAAS